MRPLTVSSELALDIAMASKNDRVCPFQSLPKFG